MGEGGSFLLWCSSLSRCPGTLPDSFSGWEGVHARAGWGSPGSVGGGRAGGRSKSSRLPDFILAVPSSPAWQTAGHDEESSRLEPGSLSSGSGSGTQSLCTFDSGQVSYLYNVWCWEWVVGIKTILVFS